MRVLIKKHVFVQPAPGYYSHTQISLVLRKPNMNDLVCHRLDEGFRSASREPDALAAALYREPRRGVSNGFNLAYGTKKAFWDYIADDSPRHGERFARAMHAVNINSLDAISRLYPFDTLAADGGLIVDIGGGQGHVAKAILTSFPNSGLKCIVQDVHVNASSVAVEGIEMQQHDFFDPQPMHGAAAYFFRHILHDWPDNACVTLLRQTARAMDRDRSRILICDQVMHDSSPSEASILYDIDMMSLFGGKERSLEEWTALVESADAGLKITKVMLDPGSEAAMLELRLN
ncbi:O-methyltransferase family protein [Aspergillus egyptiacus]|nr:O-methyltransferase family protein [Aspergillus egyptiacus]